MNHAQSASGKHWRDVYKSEYLASWDIDDGKSLILTIKECREEEAKILAKTPEDKIKVIAYFEEDYRPMIINPTNCKILQTLSGEGKFEQWKGMRIEVYAENDVRGKDGKTGKGLRVKPKLPPAPKKLEELLPTHEKWERICEKFKKNESTIKGIEKYFIVPEETKEILEREKENYLNSNTKKDV